MTHPQSSEKYQVKANTHKRSKRIIGQRILKISSISLLIILISWLINHYGVSQLRNQVEELGVWVPIGIFVLRFTSVVLPALPGTAYSVLAGGLLGFTQGLVTICLADLASCSLSFFLSRRYGRGLIRYLVGHKFMNQIDTLSKRHLERNFFLMTGFLMTGFFDFVCYTMGLTQIRVAKFAPALMISIAVSNPPIVALGAGLLARGKLLLGLALLGVFCLAIITGIVTRDRQ